MSKRRNPTKLELATAIKAMNDRWKPHTGQLSWGKSLFQDGKRYIFLSVGRQTGKMIDLETPIMTPDRGFIRYGDLKDGDSIFDEMGQVQTVIKVHPVKISPEAYRVHFDNGTHIDACADHLWTTHTKLDRRYIQQGKKVTPTVKNTKELFETQIYGTKEYNHSIPVTKPLQFPEINLPLDPYTLGAWLGDGTSANGGLTGLDKEVWENIPFEVTHSTTDQLSHYIKGIKLILKEMGVLNNKHVPEIYYRGSERQRRELLKGLLDTDGSCSKRGGEVEFSNKEKRLAEAVVILAASLGLKPSLRVKHNKKYNTDYFIVRFHGNGQDLFKIKRKQINVKSSIKPFQVNHHRISKIERLNEDKPMMCITVSGESSLYTVGHSFIPTHNTEFAVYAISRWAATHPGDMCYYVGPKQKQVEDIMWYRLIAMIPEELIDKIYHSNRKEIIFKNGAIIRARGSDDPDLARGLTPNFVVYEEFKDFKPKVHSDVFGPAIAARGATLLVIGTPPEEENHFTELADQVRTGNPAKYAYYEGSTLENPYNDIEAVKEEIARLERRGEHAKAQREYFGRFVPGGSSTIFPMFDPLKHVLPHDQLMAKYINKDISKFHLWNSVDPGTTTVFAGLFVAIHPYTKHIYVLDEIYETDRNLTSTNIIWGEIQRKSQDLHPYGDITGFEDWYKIYDSASAWFANEMSYNYGVSYIPVDKINNKKEHGVSLIKDLLLMGLLTISDRCENLIKEIQRYKTNEEGKFIKKWDHAIDALRYVLYASYYDINEAIPSAKGPDGSNSRRQLTYRQEETELDKAFKKFTDS